MSKMQIIRIKQQLTAVEGRLERLEQLIGDSKHRTSTDDVSDRLAKETSSAAKTNLEQELEQSIGVPSAMIASESETTCNVDIETTGKRNEKDMTEEDVLRDVELCRVYSFQESVWEVTVILGHRAIKPLEHVVAFCVLLVHVFLMLVICGVLTDVFFQQVAVRENRVETASAWRTLVGHRAGFADSQGQSAVSRMCNGDSLEFSGLQQTEFISLDSYLKTIFGYRTGKLVCSWCLLLWFLIIWLEMQQIGERLLAIFRLRGAETKIKASGDGFAIESVGKGRLLMIITFSIIRIVVATCLLLSGTMWLAHTENITDLILNSVALSFILDVDDLLFSSACPSAIKVFLGSLKPTNLPSRLKGEDMMAAFTTLLSAILFLVCVTVLMSDPEQQRLEETWNAYCGDQTGFILERNPVSGIWYSYASNQSDITQDTWLQKLSSQLIHDQNDGYHIPTDTYAKFKESLSIDLIETIARHRECTDFQRPDEGFLLPPLQQALPDHNAVSSCHSISSVDCGKDANIRLICPETCGCNALLSGMFSLHGCPLSKCSLTQRFQDQRGSARRFDIERQVLEVMPEWKLYWDAYVHEMNSHVSQHILQESPEVVRAKFLELGCDAFADLEIEEGALVYDFLCRTLQDANRAWDKMIFRPLRPFCPQSCGCSSRRRAHQGTYCPIMLDVAEPAEIACAGLEVRGGSLQADADCRQALRNASNPQGWYTCLPLGYNGRHLYQYTDAVGTLWAIRWETDANFDSGVRFLGEHIGLQGSSKWTLISIDSFQTTGFQGRSQLMPKSQVTRDHLPVVARFFAKSNSTEFYPPSFNWVPRNRTNSDADCAAGSITTNYSNWYRIGRENTNSCPDGWDQIDSTTTCALAAMALGIVKVDTMNWFSTIVQNSLVEEVHVEEEDPNPDYPHGCYAYGKSDPELYLNPGPGSGCSKCYSLCSLSGM